MNRAFAFVVLAPIALGCGTRAGGQAGARTTLHAAELKGLETPGTGEARSPERASEAPRAIEDTSKKSASLETAGYTDNDHVAVFTPTLTGKVENVVDGASLQGSYLVDVVSAASVDIVSTATRRWTETRHAGALSGEYKPRELGVGFSASVSSEPDYFSVGASGHLSYDLDEKNTSLFFGYGYGHDTVGRHGTPFTVFARTLLRGTFLVGMDQIIDSSTMVSFALNVMIENGDQSKPYRYIPLFSPLEAASVPQGASIAYVDAHRTFERPLEQLPLSRNRYALTSELAHRFDTSTLRVSERGYVDTWGLKASTTDARWFFDVGDRFRFWPHARFHAQTPVLFWQRAYVSQSGTGWDLPEYRTGDRELGPLFSATGGLGTKVFLGSAPHVHSLAIGFEGDVIYTSYLDDLYILNRTGLLGTLTLEVAEQ